MKTYIVFLRGVMPVGKNKVSMAQLREVLSNTDFDNVHTYIQSGNVFVSSDLSAREVEEQVHALIKRHLGPDLAVMARTGTELQEVLEGNPFQKSHDISRVFFVLFGQTPDAEKVKELLSQDFKDEKLVITKDAAYMHIPGTYGRGKLSSNFLEKKLTVSATMRNFNTMSKLVEMNRNREDLVLG